MTEHVINQTGDRSLFIERNSGAVYVGEYVADPNDIFSRLISKIKIT